MATKYWLMKSEPTVYSIDDLKRDKTTYWEGVRNYQARNMLRDDIKKGDLVFFYHSNAEPPGIAGIAKVSKSGYPDPEAFNKKSKYFDPKSKKEKPAWYVVDLTFVKRFKEILPLEALRLEKKLEGMPLLQKGSRLSVQPVSPTQWKTVENMVK
jgi:predicted RNA-binding protein with PUA-like domain